MTHKSWRCRVLGDVIEVVPEDDSNIPIVSWPGFDDCRRKRSEHVANALLIAAAPELLEVCQLVLEVFENLDEEEAFNFYGQGESALRENLQSVIDKALGNGRVKK